MWKNQIECKNGIGSISEEDKQKVIDSLANGDSMAIAIVGDTPNAEIFHSRGHFVTLAGIKENDNGLSEVLIRNSANMVDNQYYDLDQVIVENMGAIWIISKKDETS